MCFLEWQAASVSSRSLQVLWNKVNWMVGAVHLTPWYVTYVPPQALPPSAKPSVEVGSQAVGPVSHFLQEWKSLQLKAHSHMLNTLCLV